MAMPEVHSVLVLEIRRLDGRLFFLESDGLIKSSGSIGVVGGVERESISGEANAKVEAMTMGRRLRWSNVRELVKAYKPLGFAWIPVTGCNCMSSTSTWCRSLSYNWQSRQH